jgi:hypothetical protein
MQNPPTKVVFFCLGEKPSSLELFEQAKKMQAAGLWVFHFDLVAAWDGRSHSHYPFDHSPLFKVASDPG